MSKKSKTYTPSILFDALPETEEVVKKETAIVYCEGQFGKVGGKIANGLIRHSERYEIISVIDDERAGEDSGKVLNGEPNGIPIFRDLGTALAQAGRRPACLIFGTAPTGEDGKLSTPERRMMLRAIGYGINVVSGVDEFLNDDPEFAAAVEAKANVEIRDVRRPRDEKDMTEFSGRISEVTCPRVAVLGTDSATGKRTTATIIIKALSERGIKAVLIGTGPTSFMQGVSYGVALDAVPTKFRSGELENKIIEVVEKEDPDVILIEGQASLSDPECSVSSAILEGACPQGVILQHAPARKNRVNFDDVAMPDPESEIDLIEATEGTKVVGLTLSHEDMTDVEISSAIKRYEKELMIPVTDALSKSSQKLIEMVRSVLP